MAIPLALNACVCVFFCFHCSTCVYDSASDALIFIFAQFFGRTLFIKVLLSFFLPQKTHSTCFDMFQLWHVRLYVCVFFPVSQSSFVVVVRIAKFVAVLHVFESNSNQYEGVEQHTKAAHFDPFHMCLC